MISSWKLNEGKYMAIDLLNESYRTELVVLSSSEGLLKATVAPLASAILSIEK